MCKKLNVVCIVCLEVNKTMYMHCTEIIDSAAIMNGFEPETHVNEVMYLFSCHDKCTDKREMHENTMIKLAKHVRTTNVGRVRKVMKDPRSGFLVWTPEMRLTNFDSFIDMSDPA